MTPGDATTVSGDVALAAFRQGLIAPELLSHLKAGGGKLLVNLPVGVGKSHALDGIAAEVARSEPDALVLVSAPRTDILAETRGRLVKLGLDPLVLRPRPRKRCGPLDAAWEGLEQLGCSALARRTLCGACPHRAGCTWPDRWAELAGRRLVLAAQQHLANDPDFIARLQTATGARKVVALVDESDLLLRKAEREVIGTDLVRFAAAAAGTASPGPAWETACRTLHIAAQADLLARWTLPRVGPKWAADVAAEGRRRYGPTFRFVGYDLIQFARSDSSTRARLDGGGVRFAYPPDLGDEFVIFSGSAAAELVRYRLDPDHWRAPITTPFAGYRFRHPDTTWVNLADAAGTDKYFPANAGRVLDLFARLVARNIAAGKRTLLVCRKKFRELCQAEIRQRVEALVGGRVRVVTRNWTQHDLTDPRTVPLITYGISGVNRFEGHHTVYCLTGYYTARAAVEVLVNDIEPPSRQFPVELTFGTRPPRRAAVVSDPAAAVTIVPALARWTLEQKEGDVVVQAVGRVRPFTRPREVVTFQVGDLPGVTYDHQVTNLAGLRAHFGLPTPGQLRRADTADRSAVAARLKAEGKTRKEIAAELGVSLATVKRSLQAARTGGAHGAL
ncbi:MAG TPA: helix-turn-helix domain-containing protein [Urbifossiella sp.]|nr:helix-turn-helix domain-containing protein [Urbifossiella sp.]